MNLRIENLSFKYNEREILKDINLNIHSGELITILGESGAGKTTLLKVIAGIEDIQKGEIWLDDVNIGRLPIRNRDVGFIYQDPLLFPHMSVRENVGYGLKVKGIDSNSIKTETDGILKRLDIYSIADRIPREISGGQQQRVSIARTLITKPRILLMDEPFSSLDPMLRKDMGELIRGLNKDYNLTTLFVTHDYKEGLDMADRVLMIMDNGIGQIGSPMEIYYKSSNKKIAEFFGPVNYVSGLTTAVRFKADGIDISDEREKDGKTELWFRPHVASLSKSSTGLEIIDKIVLSDGISYKLRGGIDIKLPIHEDYSKGDLVDISIKSDFYCII